MKKQKFDQILTRLEKKLQIVDEGVQANDIKLLVNELNIYEAELLAQNQELLDNEQHLKNLIKQLDTLFMQAPVPYISLTKKLIVKMFNSQALEYFDLEKSQYYDKSFLSLFDKKDYEKIFKWFSDIENKEDYPIYINLNTKLGKVDFKIELKTLNNSIEDFEYLLIFKDQTNENELTRLKVEMEKNRITYLEKFIDNLDEMVILANNEKIGYANKKFLDFFGFDNINDFNKEEKNIYTYFEEGEDFFNLEKIKNYNNWLNELIKLSSSEKIVKVKSKNGIYSIFNLAINSFYNSLYSISFQNITLSYESKMILNEKLIHDKLSNAYNREYFEVNYQKLINKTQEDKLKFAICVVDIDFFKKVNDTYGHNIGDSVLKNLVQLIFHSSRKEDILIRWGGEEFLLLLKIDNMESLSTALEHIRKSIEENDFEFVGSLTCSFGATIYKKDENIDLTINRADEALYEAKRTGRNKVIVK